MNNESILFCASEVYPFAKSGGLADVAHSLPRSLQKEYDVSVVLPLYSSIQRSKYSIVSLKREFLLHLGTTSYTIELFGTTYEGVEYLFIYTPLLCDREFLYGTPTQGYEDNALRFALFNHAIVELLKMKPYTIAHLNDWQSALVPLLLQEQAEIETKTLFTIHNLAYQGLFDFETLHTIGVDSRYFTMDALEFHGRVNFLKGGIAYADAITTVSQTYAEEILTEEFGCGLDGFLRHHKKRLKGILNGIDYEHFSPQSDRLLKFPFKGLTQKANSKSAFLKGSTLRGAKKPLLIFIGRLTEQKGVDLLLESLDYIAGLECNIAILGEGERLYQERFKEKAEHSKNIECIFSYDERRSHLLYAAADFLLMPSLFEPCGLNQMIAMRYGALAVVHRVGGLKESVHNYKYFAPKEDKGYGILFEEANAEALNRSVDEALSLYTTKKEYNRVVKHNMLCDFSWSKSTELYIELYKQL